MEIDPDEFKELQMTRLSAVQKLTELNARHISSQTRLSGIEIEIVRCQEEIDNDGSNEQINQEFERLNTEYEKIMESRAVIDQEREALNVSLEKIDGLIHKISQTS